MNFSKMTWKEMLAHNMTTIEQLKEFSNIPKNEEEDIKKIIHRSPLNVTPYYLSLIDKNDPNDPIAKIILPQKEELGEGGVWDTSGEEKSTKLIGLQHKYRQTGLMLATSYCSAYCRFCFRKRMVGLTNKEILNNTEKAISYIEEHQEMTNVLISGGDPLTLDTEILDEILEKLAQIKHLHFIRIGSRVPVVLPMRIYDDTQFLEMLKKHGQKKRIYITTHFDHANELTSEAKKGIQALIDANVIPSNQTVLMKGVSDTPQKLSLLMNTLTQAGAIPYYVFQCRPVASVTHFQIPIRKGIEIVEEAKKNMNGYGKRFKYAMSHDSGKIEILGKNDDIVFFKYHQARSPENMGEIFGKKLKDECWLEEEDPLDRDILY